MNYLSIRDLDLYYHDLDRGYPVVLVHGLGSDHTVWDGLVPLLKKDNRVLNMDLRGHGQSSKTPGPYSMEIFSNDIYRFLESLNINQAHFIGHSMGGAILQELVIQHPEKFSSLTLISSFAYIDKHLKKVLLKLRKILCNDKYNAFFDACLKLANTNEFIEENREILLKIRNNMAQTSSITSLEDTINACLKVNFIDSLKSVKIPTLVIAGEEDIFIPPYHGIKIKNTIPHSKIEIMDAASHNMLVERPTETFLIIEKFLLNL